MKLLALNQFIVSNQQDRIQQGVFGFIQKQHRDNLTYHQRMPLRIRKSP